MPNWCENDLTIRGDAEEVAAFMDFARRECTTEDGYDKQAWTQYFHFSAFIPYPLVFSEPDEACFAWDKAAIAARATGGPMPEGPRPQDGYNRGGYEWCIHNWGTKWGAKEPRLGKRKEHDLARGKEVSQVIHFDTAWSPPLPVVRKAAETFPNLTFDLRYYECGAAFHGRLKLEKGKEVINQRGAYHGDRGG
jgi:hypothetical protein